jgi:hypothetical protein
MRPLLISLAVLGIILAALLIRPPAPDLDLQAIIDREAELPGWAASLGERLGRFAPRVEAFASGERSVTLPVNSRLDQELPPDPDHDSRIATFVLERGPAIGLEYICTRLAPGDRCLEGRQRDTLAPGESLSFDIGPGGGTVRSDLVTTVPRVIAFAD